MQDNQPIALTYGQLTDMVDRIEQIPTLSGSGAPTTSTPAFYKGQLYLDTTNNKLYVCEGLPVSGASPYTWVEVSPQQAAFKPYPSTVNTTGTTSQFISSIQALHAPVGSAYLGTVTLSDMPASLTQEEVLVYIYNSNLVYCIMYSANTAPYAWWCNSFDYRGWESMMGPTVVQATGQSTADVMSQKAVTDALSNIPSGGITTLTSADYDYHTSGSTDNSVALWRLAPGVYTKTNGVRTHMNSSSSNTTAAIILVGKNGSNNEVPIMMVYGTTSLTGGGIYSTNKSNGTSLSSTSFGNSGAIINGGTTAPTSSTYGSVGTVYSYVDTTGSTPEPHLMVCTSVTGGYTWVDVMGTVASALNVINNGAQS